MNVSVSVRCWKQTTSSHLELRARSRLSELICPRLNPPSRTRPLLAGPERAGELDREENEEHLHLNGMFFFPASCLSVCLVMTWLCADRGMRGNPLF